MCPNTGSHLIIYSISFKSENQFWKYQFSFHDLFVKITNNIHELRINQYFQIFILEIHDPKCSFSCVNVHFQNVNVSFSTISLLFCRTIYALNYFFSVIIQLGIYIYLISSHLIKEGGWTFWWCKSIQIKSLRVYINTSKSLKSHKKNIFI